MRENNSSHKKISRVIIEIIKLTLRIWFTDLSRSLGSKRSAYLVIISISLVLFTVGGFSAFQGNSLGIGAEFLTSEGAASLCALLFTVPAISTVLAQVYSPSKTLITEMLVILPVDKRSIRFSTNALTGMLGLFFGLTFLAVLAGPVLKIINSHPLTFFAISIFPILGVSNSLLFLIGISGILRLIKINPVASEIISAVSTVIIFGWWLFAAMPINHNLPHGPHAWVTAPFLRAVAGLEPISNIFIIGTLFLVIFFASVVISTLDFCPSGQISSIPFLKFRKCNLSLVGLEAIQILRFPPNFISLLLLNFIGLFSCIFILLHDGNDGMGLGALLLLSISCWGVGAYGPTRNHHWIYRASGESTRWIWPKLLAVLALWSISICVHGTWLILLTEWQVIDFIIMLPTLFIEVVAACSIGILLPVGGSNSISGTIAESVGIAASFGISLVIQNISGMFNSLPGIVCFYAVLIFLSIYVYLAIGRKASNMLERI